MNTRMVVLLSILLALGAGYAWFFLLPGGSHMRMVIVQAPSQPPTFGFDRETIVREVRMVVLEPVDAADPDGETFERTIWHLAPRTGDGDGARAQREPRPRKSITYGRRVRGLAPVEGMSARGEPLKPGLTYQFIAHTSDGIARAEFVAR